MRPFHEFKLSQVKPGLYLIRMSLDFTSGETCVQRNKEKPRNGIDCWELSTEAWGTTNVTGPVMCSVSWQSVPRCCMNWSLSIWSRHSDNPKVMDKLELTTRWQSPLEHSLLFCLPTMSGRQCATFVHEPDHDISAHTIWPAVNFLNQAQGKPWQLAGWSTIFDNCISTFVYSMSR